MPLTPVIMPQPAGSRGREGRSQTARSISPQKTTATGISVRRATRTSPAKSTTHLPPAVLVGQTDRMMTEAEALQTLAREDPAVADDARAALRSLTAGGGLEAISLLRLQEFLWCALPNGVPQAAERQLAVAAALARLLTLAGMERYAEVCAGTDTARILGAYAISRDEGLDAYAKALNTSHAVPPDTDLLAWSSAMGTDERSAYDACAAAIELAVAARELKVGVSGWKTKRAGLVERWLTRDGRAPGPDHR